MKKAILILMVAGLLGFVGIGSAGAFQQVTLTLTGTYNDNATYNGVLAGPYQFTVGTTKDVPLNCDTYINEIYEGETWTANVIPGNDLTTSNTLFGSGFYVATSQTSASVTVQVAYDEMFWLVEQMNATSNTTPAGLTTIEDIQYAIWTIADPNNHPPAGMNTDETNWLAEAVEFGSSVNPSDFLVYTPVPGSQPKGYGTPQEFIQMVPEPNSLIFLGFSLLMVAGAVTLKVRKAHA